MSTNQSTLTIEDISVEDFSAYEAVRESGITNMFDVRTVCDLSGLDRAVVLAVMKHYRQFCERYPDVRNLKT